MILKILEWITWNFFGSIIAWFIFLWIKKHVKITYESKEDFDKRMEKKNGR